MTSKKREDTTIITTCPHDCGGRCVLRAHVRDGRITRIETDSGAEPQLRACARGRAYRQRVYAPDRLLYPMQRVGPRGSGRFERIGWDAALDRVSTALRTTIDSFGNNAILYIGYSGNTGTFLHNQLAVFRLLSMLGGFTPVWGSASFWGSLFSSETTYGTITAGHPPEDILNARMIIMWGWNPAETVQRTNTAWYLARAREQGARIVAIDPRYTDSAAAFAHQWIPIRPATDTAMLLAMAHVMISEDLHDRTFLAACTTGFEEFQDYVLGRTDTCPKTPDWAGPITGVEPAVIADLARQYAATRPAKLLTLGAPGRTAFGEQFHRAAATLAAMTGNVGVPGGDPAGFGLAPVGLKPETGTGLIARRMPGNLPEGARQRPAIHITRVWDALLQGTAGGYPADMKLVYITNANPVNQFMNTNKAVQALEQVDTVIVHEQFMTPTARFADILLPVTTQFERNDIIRPWQGGDYCFYMRKAVEPPGETRSDLDICAGLAGRLGLAGYSEATEDQWLREFWQEAGNLSHATPLPAYEELRDKGLHRFARSGPEVAFQSQVAAPDDNPFPTPSGKIEIFSQSLQERGDPQLPPIATYIPPREGPEDPLACRYPLQLISTHSKRRIHSNMHTLPWLRDLEPHALWISTADARARGIAHGTPVRVFNDRGQVIVPARVTARIMPGVVSLGQGAWFRPGTDGADRGGCVNVLLSDAHSPAGAFCSNSCLVQVAVHTEDEQR